MSAAPLLSIFVDHYAAGPSGITTYGTHLAATLPELVRINLHAPVASLTRVGGRVDVPPVRSHDSHLLADLLVGLLHEHPHHRIAWLPNVGHVPWAGAWRALERLSADERERVRIFGIVHGDQASQYESMQRYAAMIAALAGVSRRCVDALTRAIPSDGPSIELLDYPVEMPVQSSPPRRDEPLRLLYAGRLEESQKRVSRLPDLFRALAAAGVPFTATIAGDGPDRASLETAIGALPADVVSRIDLVGVVSPANMPALLRAHDVLLLVSAFEGTPLVLLEAMATALCPVLMDLPGGLPDLLADGQNACVVPQGDVMAMVAALGVLASERERLTRLQEAARATMIRRAAPDQHARWLRARLEALWSLAAPDPAAVRDPDMLGRRVDALVEAVVAARVARIGIWGAGVVGRQIVDALLRAGIAPAMMVDADDARHGHYRDVPIASPGALFDAPPEIVCVGSLAFSAEIERGVKARGLPCRIMVP